MEPSRSSSKVDQVSSPKRLWCYGEEAGQDVTILLRSSNNTNNVEAELKMHSKVLKQFSRYFEVALKERWSNPSASPALLTFSLEMISEVHAGCYIQCFERMYQPFKRAFKTIESSLHLLRAASHIDYDKLTMDICGYLSAKRWSKDEELLIRQYASSEDFPSSQAKDLMVRLSLDVSTRSSNHKKLGDVVEDGSTRTSDHKKLGDVVEESIRLALGRGRNDPPMMSTEDARSFIIALFAGIGESVKNPEYHMDTTSIINKATKELLVEFEEECKKHIVGANCASEASLVPRFGRGLEAIQWILDKLMEANVAEEVVGCFLHLELYPKIYKAARYSHSIWYNHLGVEIGRLVMLMHQKATRGDLVLEESARVMLFQQWDLYIATYSATMFHNSMEEEEVMELRMPREELMTRVLQAKEDVFCTLSFGKQMELVRQGVCGRFESFISVRVLASVVKQKWSA